MIVRRLQAAALCCAVILSAGVCFSQMQRDSVVVLYLNNDEMVVKLYAELKALGYVPVVLKRPSDGMSIDDLKEIVHSSNSVALMNTYSLDNRVDVWVADSDRQSIRLVETVDSGQRGQTRDAVILKSVELLRARLMKIEKMREQGQGGLGEDPGGLGDPGSAAFVRRFSLELAPMVTYGFGELPPALQMFLGAHVVALGRVGIDLMGFFPTYSMKTKNAYGKARVWNFAISSGLRVDLMPHESYWIPWIAACVGAQFIRTQGVANEGFSSENDLIGVGIAFMRLGLNISLVEGALSLQVAVHAGSSFPTPTVGLGDENLKWGVPLIGGQVGIKVDLF